MRQGTGLDHRRIHPPIPCQTPLDAILGARRRPSSLGPDAHWLAPARLRPRRRRRNAVRPLSVGAASGAARVGSDSVSLPQSLARRVEGTRRDKAEMEHTASRDLPRSPAAEMHLGRRLGRTSISSAPSVSFSTRLSVTASRSARLRVSVAWQCSYASSTSRRTAASIRAYRVARPREGWMENDFLLSKPPRQASLLGRRV